MGNTNNEKHDLKWWLTIIYVVLGAIIGMLGTPVSTALSSML